MSSITLITSLVDIEKFEIVAEQMNLNVKVMRFDLNHYSEVSLRNINTEYVFIALEPTYLKIPFIHLYKEAKLRKYNVINLIDKSVLVHETCTLQDNIYIGENSTIGASSKIAYGVEIASSVLVASNVYINQCSTIKDSVRIQAHSSIGCHVYIGSGSVIKSIKIGDFCCLENSYTYDNDLKSNSHYLSGHRSFIYPLN